MVANLVTVLSLLLTLWHPEPMRPPRVASAAFRRLSPRTRSALLHRIGIFAPWEDGFDFTPPAPGPGLEAGAPDFVGVGVQKAGTSWWYELIADHPAVSADGRDSKGAPLLLPLLRWRLSGGERSTATGGGSHAGPARSSANGLPTIWVTRGWRHCSPATAPEVKVLVILRDPVDRFRSGSVLSVASGRPRQRGRALPTRPTGLLRAWAPSASSPTSTATGSSCSSTSSVSTIRSGQLTETYRFLGLPDHTPAELRRANQRLGCEASLRPGGSPSPRRPLPPRRRRSGVAGPDTRSLALAELRCARRLITGTDPTS